MVNKTESLKTSHEDILHDAQMDYYGKRLATCSSDRTIKVFDVVNGAHQLTATLRDHEGAVWQLSWAHPKFGSLLATCSYDKRVIIWKEESAGSWNKIYTHQVHDLSVNSVSWGPHEFGLHLVCGSSDGFVSILSSTGTGWTYEKFLAHNGGCNTVCWAPAFEQGELVLTSEAKMVPTRRIATGGSDNLIKIWSFDDATQKWGESPTYTLKKHDDWVRDVAWCPNLGLPGSVLASCGQDMKVYLWTLEPEPSAEWVPKPLEGFTDVCWRVSWSVTGHVLAVTSFDKVTLWKESATGEWQKVHDMNQQAPQ